MACVCKVCQAWISLSRAMNTVPIMRIINKKVWDLAIWKTMFPMFLMQLGPHLNTLCIRKIDTKISSSSLKSCSNWVGVSYMNSFSLHCDLSCVKSWNKLHSFKSIVTTFIHVLFRIPISIGGALTCRETFHRQRHCWPTLDVRPYHFKRVSYILSSVSPIFITHLKPE